MSQPLISVVVPNLNDAPYLRRFLESLANQGFGDYELIIVDGGSTDGSLEIIDKFALSSSFPVRTIIDKTRNIGYIRNLGSNYARGGLLFHTNSDVILDPWLLLNVYFEFGDPDLIALAGRTKPVGSQLLTNFAYQSFDLLRWLFSRLPGSMKKFSPGGNFLVIRKSVFRFIRGFPNASINEDGLMGRKLLLFHELSFNSKVKFDLGLYVQHYVKRFQGRGISAMLFYSYVFRNLFPFLEPVLLKIEAQSAEKFTSRVDV